MAAAKLETLSRERVADELLKLLGTEDPRFAVSRMLDAGIFEHIIEAVDRDSQDMFNGLVEREQQLHVTPSALRRLVALLPKEADKASHIAKSLKLSKKQQKAIGERLSLVSGNGFGGNAEEPGTNSADIRAFAYRTNVDVARDVVLLFAEETSLSAMLARLKDWQPPVFPLTGGYLIEQGLKPGPVVAATLAKIETAWIAQGFPDEQWVRKFIEDQNLTHQS